LPGPAPDDSRPRGHRHDVLTVRLTVCLAVEARLSLRQVAFVLALLAPFTAVGRCAFSTARQWLLRLGLAALRRAVRAVPGGWTLVVDHTLGRGTRECLVVLGIPTDDLRRRPDHRLAPADVTALAVEVMDNPTGASVAAVLGGLLLRLGRVDQVVCDRGGDLLAGLGRLREGRPEMAVTCDVRHLCAALLRCWLRGCPRWAEFVRLAGASAHKVRQTPGAFLAPPALRDKARYMNLDSHVAWAQRLLRWRSGPDWPALAVALGKGEAEARGWFEQRFGWLLGFGRDVAGWSGMLAAAALAQDEVQQSGLSRRTAGRFWQRWRQQPGPGCFAAERFAGQTRVALSREGGKLGPGRVGLGSSDVIESLFGKYKEVMARGPEKEVTADVLLLALMSGPGLSSGEVKAGLEQVDTRELRRWQAEQFGPSDRAKRRGLFGPPGPNRPPITAQEPA
jgi:hypothetical protein